MAKFTATLAVLLSSSLLIGCTHDIEKGILEERSGYHKLKPTVTKVSRTGGIVKKAWLHAHEMPSGDYFGGAWVYLLVEKTTWKIND